MDHLVQKNWVNSCDEVKNALTQVGVDFTRGPEDSVVGLAPGGEADG